MHPALGCLLLAAAAPPATDRNDGADAPAVQLESKAEPIAQTGAGSSPLEPGRHRSLFVGVTSGLDPGVFGVRLGLTPIPELSLEAHAGALLNLPVIGLDVRVRPLARFSTLTPTLRYGVGAAIMMNWIWYQAVAAGLEWNHKSGLSIEPRRRHRPRSLLHVGAARAVALHHLPHRAALRGVALLSALHCEPVTRQSRCRGTLARIHGEVALISARAFRSGPKHLREARTFASSETCAVRFQAVEGE